MLSAEISPSSPLQYCDQSRTELQSKMSLVCIADFEEKAKTLIEKNALDYYRGGAGDEYTLQLNKRTFRSYRIRPRCLRDVTNVDTSVEVLGMRFEWPVGIAPTAMQRMAHPDGEVASARAAGKLGSVFILSTVATSSIEEVAEGAPDTTKWLQLYIYKDRAITEGLIRRAERAGFKAIVLTVDAPVFGFRRADVRNQFKLPAHLRLANFEGLQSTVNSTTGTSAINEYVSTQFDASLTWADVDWLIKFTKLPIIVKGVLAKEDAILALHHGCQGIIVSNHGARQVDSVSTALEVLPEIVEAVGRDMTVMMDGGVSSGADVLTALALGARMVFVGRPVIWGLSVNGQKGVEQMLSVLRKDFDITLALTGCASVSNVTRDMVVHESRYSKL